MKDEGPLAPEPGEGGMLLYCECGHTLWCEVWRVDEERVVFLDGVETSKRYEDVQVIYCPGCGERVL